MPGMGERQSIFNQNTVREVIKLASDSLSDSEVKGADHEEGVTFYPRQSAFASSEIPYLHSARGQQVFSSA